MDWIIGRIWKDREKMKEYRSENNEWISLEDELKKEFVEHRAFWKYYGDELLNPFESVEAAKEFIINYFEQGSKMSAIQEWRENIDADVQFRNNHTINVFFIGAMLQRKIDRNLVINSEVQEAYPFSYIWFLVCLAHDFGYIYENEENLEKMQYMKEEYEKLFDMQENSGKYVREYMCRLHFYRKVKLNIKRLGPNFPLEKWASYCKQKKYRNRGRNYREECRRECRRECRGEIRFNNGTIIRRSWYNSVTKDKYFRYRLLHMKKLDHGIVGADKLFSDLIENYYNQFANNKSRGQFNAFENNQQRHFSCEHFKIFAYIADCIAAHNVFKAEDTDESKEIYKKYGLNCLLLDNFEIISYRENPLLFILSVADTLEPSKRFRNCSEVLKKISIDYNKKSNTVLVGIASGLAMSKEGEKYIDDIYKLEEWCDINVDVTVI